MAQAILKFLSCMTVILLLGMTATLTHAQDTLQLNLGEEEVPQTDYKEEADNFFRECVKRPIMPTNEETDMAFCACAASHYHAWLLNPKQTDTSKEFFETFDKIELDEQTLLTEVYGPCMYVSIYDDTYEQCYYNDEKPYFRKSPARRRNYCHCEAQGESDYFKDFLVPFIEKQIQEGKKIVDPINDLRRDMHYYDNRRRVHAACYSEEVHRKHYD